MGIFKSAFFVMIKNLFKKFHRKIRDYIWRVLDKDKIPQRVSPNDLSTIVRLKRNFEHFDRDFVHGFRYRVVDCLYCHAVPGTVERVVLELDRLIKKDKTKNKLLNLGGGAGQTSAIFRELGFDVYNLDIEVKKETKRNVRFDLNKSSELPYPKESFNVVTCQETIEHIEDPWDLFRKVREVLKPGGYLILTTPNIQSLYSRRKFLQTGYFHWFAPQNFSYHVNALPAWEVEMIAEKTGFEEIKVLGNGDYYFNRTTLPSKNEVLDKNEALIFVFQKR